MQVTVITKRGQSLTDYLTLYGTDVKNYPINLLGTSDLMLSILSKNIVYYPLNYTATGFTPILSKFIAFYPISFDASESQGNLISVFLEDYPLEASESGLERLIFRTPVIYPIELPGSPPVSGNSFVGNAINQIPFGIEIIFPESFSGIAINSIPFKIILADTNVFLGLVINTIPFSTDVSGTTDNFNGTAINDIPFSVNIGGTTDNFNGTAINNIPFGVNISGTTDNFNGTAINNIPFGVNISGTAESFVAPSISNIPFTVIDWPRLQPFNYNYNVLNIVGTGTNNTTNNTFLDSSANNITISKFDNATQGSFSPHSTAPGAWSVYFDGNGDWITVPSSSAFSIPTSTTPFTVEAWVYPTAAGGAIFSEQYTGGSNSVAFSLTLCDGVQIDNTTGLVPAFGYYSSPGWVTAAMANTSISLNQWSHIAAVFTGSTSKIFINGVDYTKTSSPTPATTWGLTGNNGNEWYVGRRWDNFGTAFFTGYISNFRFVNGSAVYTNDFPPSTTPLTAVSGTSLLACQNNRFIDNSSNAFTLNVNGNTAINSFSPFFPASSYTPSTQGGSIYLAGIDDFLYNENDSAANVLSGNFTMEGWFYFLAGEANEYQAIYTNYFDPFVEGTMFLGKSADIGGQLSFWAGNFNLYAPLLADPTLPTSNTWTHYAVVKNGTNYQLYRNGVSVASATWAGTLSATAGPIFVGTYGSAPGDYIMRGYISDFRIVNGTAVYTSNFTPPSTALTAITNTSLLLGGRNAAIFDSSFDNVIETLGDAKISTAVSATGSILLDGVGDYLRIPRSSNYDFGRGDFTIEMWIRFNALVDNRAILTYGWPTINAPFLLYVDTVNNRISFYSSSNGSSWDIANQMTIISSPATNTWYHIAVSRSGNTFRTFSNGTLVSMINSSAALFVPGSNITLTVGGDNTGSNNVNCYINNLSINKGTALYVGNFIPPARS